MKKDARFWQRGEVATLLTIAAMVAVGLSVFVTSLITSQHKNISITRATGIVCDPTNQYISLPPPDSAPNSFAWEPDCGSTRFLRSDIRAQRSYCVSSSECLQNIGNPDSGNVNPATSNFCYNRFGDGDPTTVQDNRCLMLRYPPALITPTSVPNAATPTPTSQPIGSCNDAVEEVYFDKRFDSSLGRDRAHCYVRTASPRTDIGCYVRNLASESGQSCQYLATVQAVGKTFFRYDCSVASGYSENMMVAGMNYVSCRQPNGQYNWDQARYWSGIRSAPSIPAEYQAALLPLSQQPTPTNFPVQPPTVTLRPGQSLPPTPTFFQSSPYASQGEACYNGHPCNPSLNLECGNLQGTGSFQIGTCMPQAAPTSPYANQNEACYNGRSCNPSANLVCGEIAGTGSFQSGKCIPNSTNPAGSYICGPQQQCPSGWDCNGQDIPGGYGYKQCTQHSSTNSNNPPPPPPSSVKFANNPGHLSYNVQIKRVNIYPHDIMTYIGIAKPQNLILKILTTKDSKEIGKTEVRWQDIRDNNAVNFDNSGYDLKNIDLGITDSNSKVGIYAALEKDGSPPTIYATSLSKPVLLTSADTNKRFEIGETSPAVPLLVNVCKPADLHTCGGVNDGTLLYEIEDDNHQLTFYKPNPSTEIYKTSDCKVEDATPIDKLSARPLTISERYNKYYPRSYPGLCDSTPRTAYFNININTRNVRFDDYLNTSATDFRLYVQELKKSYPAFNVSWKVNALEDNYLVAANSAELSRRIGNNGYSHPLIKEIDHKVVDTQGLGRPDENFDVKEFRYEAWFCYKDSTQAYRCYVGLLNGFPAPIILDRINTINIDFTQSSSKPLNTLQNP